MKYKYYKGKFSKNGHTMFEQDVLKDLERLSYLEEQRLKDNWISVEDRLPEDLIFNCLVCLENDGVFEGIFSSNDNIFWSLAHGDFKEGNLVTHWQPLPEPPKK